MGQNDCQPEDPRRAITAIDSDDPEYIGVSVCSPNDSFRRKTGQQLALKSLKDNTGFRIFVSQHDDILVLDLKTRECFYCPGLFNIEQTDKIVAWFLATRVKDIFSRLRRGF